MILVEDFTDAWISNMVEWLLDKCKSEVGHDCTQLEDDYDEQSQQHL